MIHVELLPFTDKQTNKQTRTIKYTCDTGFMYMHGSVVPSLFSFKLFKTLSYFAIRYVFLL